MKCKSLAAALTLALSSMAASAADVYVTDPHHTFARFNYNHLGYSNQESRFDKVSGTITLDSKAQTGSVDITIDTKSVNTGSALFNEHIQAADFLDTEKFPTASFKSSKLNFKGEQLVSVDGTLTLKGIAKPVTLEVTGFKCAMHPMLKKDACGANASTKVKRSEFNMGKAVPYVSDEVTITLSVEALKQ